MEIFRLFFCSFFILYLYGCIIGVKKKKDLEIIVEVSFFYESYIFSCSFYENWLNYNLICFWILIVIFVWWYVYFIYLLFLRLWYIYRLLVNYFIWDKVCGLLFCSNLSNVLFCVIFVCNLIFLNLWLLLIWYVLSFK